jgi:hypothetical protein
LLCRLAWPGAPDLVEATKASIPTSYPFFRGKRATLVASEAGSDKGRVARVCVVGYRRAMKRINLDETADFIGNRPPKPAGVQLIRRHDQRRPMIDIEEGDVEAAEEQRRKAILDEKERSRAEYQAKAAASAPKPVKAKPQAKRKKT